MSTMEKFCATFCAVAREAFLSFGWIFPPCDKFEPTGFNGETDSPLRKPPRTPPRSALPSQKTLEP